MRIVVAEKTGEFAGNKDIARTLREFIAPALAKAEDVFLDFGGVDLATQSFVHAMISDLVRRTDLDALDHLVFERCNENVQSIIEIVVEYSQSD